MGTLDEFGLDRNLVKPWKGERVHEECGGGDWI